MNWLRDNILGALIGLIIPWVLKFLYYQLNLFKKRTLKGVWNGYHLTYYDGTFKILHSVWTIRRGVFQDYTVIAQHSNVTYTGAIKPELNDLVITMKSTSHKEVVVYRFNNPLKSKQEIIPGIWLSYDHDINICSAAAFLSKEQLTEEELMKKFSEYFQKETGLPLMRIKGR